MTGLIMNKYSERQRMRDEIMKKIKAINLDMKISLPSGFK
jgi:hypothetical protein